MTEPNDAGAAPAADPATPPAGADAASMAAAPAAAPALDPAIIQKELDQARKDAAKYREQIRLREEADKSEEQKRAERVKQIEDENAALKAQVSRSETRTEVLTQAQKLAFKDPMDAYRLVESDIEYDDAGKPKNVERLLTELAKAKVYLTNGTTDYGQGPRGSAPNSSSNVDDMIRAAARGR